MTTAEDLAPLVSLHACTRYVQRVLGVEVMVPADELPAHSSQRGAFIAARHCEAVGLSLDQIRQLVMTPAVALAAAMKMTEVSTREFRARLAPNGVVTTVLEPMGKPTKPIRMLSDREAKAKAKKHHRQMKRRPATCRR